MWFSVNILDDRRGPLQKCVRSLLASDQGDPSIGFTSESRSSATQSGHNIQPLVFAAKFRQVRYKLSDDHLVSCCLVEDKPVPVGFFGENESDPEDNRITSIEDLVRLIESGDIEIEFVDGGIISPRADPAEPIFWRRALLCGSVPETLASLSRLNYRILKT